MDAILGTHLVDADGRDALCRQLGVGEGSKGGGQRDGAAFRQSRFGLSRHDGAAFPPSGKAVARRRFSPQGDGSKEMAVEVGVGHVDAVDVEVCPLCVGSQLDGLCGSGEFGV